MAHPWKRRPPSVVRGPPLWLEGPSVEKEGRLGREGAPREKGARLGKGGSSVKKGGPLCGEGPLRRKSPHCERGTCREKGAASVLSVIRGPLGGEGAPLWKEGPLEIKPRL